MKILFGLLRNSVLLILNFFGRCIPRNKKIWLYGGFGKRFIDNSKYLFINLNESEKDIKHIWITDSFEDEIFLKNKGFLCYRRKSFKGFFFSLRAKVFIYGCYPDEVNTFAFSGGAFLFNLWHGVGFKKIEYDINVGPLKKIFHPKGIVEQINAFSFQPALFNKSEAVLCPLEDFRVIFQGAFRVKEKNVCMAPYPRTFPFFWNEIKLLNHIEKYEPLEMKSLIEKCKHYKKVWIYMPTWRDANPDFIYQAIPDFKLLDEICKEQDVLFLLKLHLATNITFEKNQWDNIVFVPNYFDVYPLLPFTTTLLTDYSSIFLDYQLLNKKTVFYPFDLNEYLSKSREMYFEYDELAIGDKVYSFNELIAILAKEDTFIDDSSCVTGNNTDNGSEVIVSFIKKKII